MEALSRTESSGTASAAALELVLVSAVESLALEMILDAGKSLFWLLCVLGFSSNGGDLFDEGCEIIKGFPLSSLMRSKNEPMPENKDDGESDDEDDEDEDDEGGDQDDDGGEEDYSGDEGNEEDEDEDEIEANGGGGGSEEEDDEDEDEDDDDDEDGDDEEDEGDEDEDEDQPPTKKRK
ncbi:hypothetical protein HPP92_017694 [Vanilla planifolia]|uniref:Uncharacterized protein n=1 Tax=Vanilla planifolia TaxID=51239 RepID=A0A835PGV8_VANPL|nr:hypothetical protein HPP92_026427 [Vanilla planifolia]KAG0468366.1 hypothetical protein HPP92_017694 [Vanilla planifolia]